MSFVKKFRFLECGFFGKLIVVLSFWLVTLLAQVTVCTYASLCNFLGCFYLFLSGLLLLAVTLVLSSSYFLHRVEVLLLRKQVRTLQSAIWAVLIHVVNRPRSYQKQNHYKFKSLTRSFLPKAEEKPGAGTHDPRVR